jgi:hypothetical protein
MHTIRSIANLKKYLAPLSACFLLSACGGGGGGGGSDSTSRSSVSSSSANSVSSVSSASSAAASFAAFTVDSPDALADALDFEGGYRQQADIPAPENPTGGRLSASTEMAITAGGKTQLDLSVEDLPEGMHVHAYLIQIEGSQTSFVIPVNSDGQPYVQSATQLAVSDKRDMFLQKTSNTIMAANEVGRRTQLNCSGYPNLTFTAGGVNNEAPSYDAPAKVYAYVQADVPPVNPPAILIPSMSRERNNWTEPATVNMKAVRVGSGKFQVTLTWNTEADVDLYLEEPDGNEISYYNTDSVAGDGFLDVDDIDGFGPENIYFEDNMPAGEYKVSVNLFGINTLEDLPTRYTVKVKRDNVSDVFTGTLNEEDETDEITRFTVNANGSTSGSGSGTSTGPGSTTPGSYATKPNTLVGSAACQGYTNDNYMEYFAQNSSGLDVQLHTLCAAAFNYYAMYLNAIRMGYSESEANITYKAFTDAALVATNFYETAQ